MIKNDAIRTLVRCMHTHTGNEDMMREICGVMGCAATKRTKVQDMCREVGAIDALLSMAERYKHSTMILSTVRSCLAAITDNHDKNSAYVVEKTSSKQTRILGRFDHLGVINQRLQGNASMQAQMGIKPRPGEGTQRWWLRV